jgi:hypothetical protein
MMSREAGASLGSPQAEPGGDHVTRSYVYPPNGPDLPAAAQFRALRRGERDSRVDQRMWFLNTIDCSRNSERGT